jgi:Glycosyltransferase like family 2
LDLDLVVRGSPSTGGDRIGATLQRCTYPDLRVRILVDNADAAAKLRADFPDVEILTVADPRTLTRELVTSSRAAPFKVIMDAALWPERDDWLREAVGTMELDDEVGIVGGCMTTPTGGTVHLDFVAGLDGFMATPRGGQNPRLMARQAAFRRRRVTAVHGGLLMIRARLFDAAEGPLGIDTDDSFNGIEYCLRMRRAGWHIGWCPTFAVRRATPLEPPNRLDPAKRADLLRLYGDLLERDSYYSEFLSRRSTVYGDLERSLVAQRYKIEQ